MMLFDDQRTDLLVVRKNNSCGKNAQKYLVPLIIEAVRKYLDMLYGLYMTKAYERVKNYDITMNTREKVLVIDNYIPLGTKLTIDLFLDTTTRLKMLKKLIIGARFTSTMEYKQASYAIPSFINAYFNDEIEHYVESINDKYKTSFTVKNEDNAKIEISFNTAVENLTLYESYDKSTRTLNLLMILDSKIVDKDTRRVIAQVFEDKIPIPSERRKNVKKILLEYKVGVNSGEVNLKFEDDGIVDIITNDEYGKLLKKLNIVDEEDDGISILSTEEKKYYDVRHIHLVIYPRVLINARTLPIKICGIHIPHNVELTLDQLIKLLQTYDDKFKNCCLILTDTAKHNISELIENNDNKKLINNTINNIASNNCKLIIEDIARFLMGYPDDVLKEILYGIKSKSDIETKLKNKLNKVLCNSFANLIINNIEYYRVNKSKLDLTPIDEKLFDKYVNLYTFQPVVFI